MSFPFEPLNITLLDTFHIAGSVINLDFLSFRSLNVFQVDNMKSFYVDEVAPVPP